MQYCSERKQKKDKIFSMHASLSFFFNENLSSSSSSVWKIQTWKKVDKRGLIVFSNKQNKTKISHDEIFFRKIKTKIELILFASLSPLEIFGYKTKKTLNKTFKK